MKKKAWTRAAAALQRKDGMASILVVFTLLILSLFAVLTFATARANANLSAKAALWSREYYSLDAFAERQRAELEALLAPAEAFAADYVRSGGYAEAAYPGLPDAHRDVAAAWVQTPEGQRAAFVASAAERAYLYRCAEELTRLPSAQPDLLIEPDAPHTALPALFDMNKPLPDSSGLRIGYLVSQQDVEQPKMLSVTLAVAQPAFYAAGQGNGYALKRQDAFIERFSIVEWVQYQQPFDMEDGQQWWDGSIQPE